MEGSEARTAGAKPSERHVASIISKNIKLPSKGVTRATPLPEEGCQDLAGEQGLGRATEVGVAGKPLAFKSRPA